MTADTLTKKQQAFVAEFLIDLDGAKAARRAGYSPHTANRIASENLTKPVIIDALQKAMSERAERTQISQDYVITGLRENYERAMQISPVLDSDGVKTGEYVYNGAVANRALELLGKHVGLFPTATTMRHTGDVNINHNLNGARDGADMLGEAVKRGILTLDQLRAMASMAETESDALEALPVPQSAIDATFTKSC